jgi:hypothetical protein
MPQADAAGEGASLDPGAEAELPPRPNLERRRASGRSRSGFLWAFLFGLALAGSNGRSRATDQPPYQVLDSDLAALRQQFDADAGRVRILLLLSPT